MRKSYFLSLLFIPFLMEAASIEDSAPNLGNLRVVSVARTPEPDHAVLKLIFPRDFEIKSSSPIALQLRVEGYPIGTESDFPRTKEIYNDPHGQTIHVCIDNEPYFEVNEAFINSLDDSREYFIQTLEVDIPFKVSPGKHLIRAFAVRSFGESLKDEGASTSSIFYYQTKKGGQNFDLTQPYLTYNEPQGNYRYNPKIPIMLDFLINNAELSNDGYKVRFTIDNTNKRILTSWVPYFIYGLKKGVHTLRLELLDSQNNKVEGYLNDVKRTIKVE